MTGFPLAPTYGFQRLRGTHVNDRPLCIRNGRAVYFLGGTSSVHCEPAEMPANCGLFVREFEPPTRPLYPDVSGAYASHRLPIIAWYFLERRTIGIGLRHVRRLRLLSGVDFVE